MNDTVRIGMISFAHLHAEGYAGCVNSIPHAELVAITDDDPERGRSAAAQFGATFEPDLATLLARDDIDAVIICSENVHHKRLTLAAAEAGKHVLCEKPLATTVEDAQAMIDVCARHGVKLQTAFPVRFNAATVALHDAVRSGQIGAPLAVNARNPGTCPMSWFVEPELAGGGAVIDHTVHVVDALRWIFDAEFTDVYAEIDTRIHDIPADDTGLLMLTMSNGVPVSLDTSWSRPVNWPIWGGVEIEVIGENGVLSLDAYSDVIEIAEIRGPSLAWEATQVSGDPEMVSAFIDAVRNDTPPPVTGEDGLRAVQVALGAYESARTHAPVRLAS
ncbi:MAG: NADH-dependent dyhydrogenase [uncultured Thermomicrobiales bacterium]|uniref:NADH-dependent dyhydrogenase n=1 Tax=uncultured Thermomicrobiales bacterium TaxID=1645740 RepID=A0A6J4UN25_9BACT|nr:MAG: NADH-dependent dyhydrogenase [uncultured Thermomicrobiales bacterium]